MSLWQITKNGLPIVANGQAVVVDDGVWASPGEDGFTQDVVRADVAARGTGYSFNYIGRTPTAAPAAPTGE